MPDDKDRDKGEDTSGVKGRLRDEFDEAAGEDKDAGKGSEAGGKGPGGVKGNIKDEFDEAAGGEKKSGGHEEDKEGSEGDS